MATRLVLASLSTARAASRPAAARTARLYASLGPSSRPARAAAAAAGKPPGAAPKHPAAPRVSHASTAAEIEAELAAEATASAAPKSAPARTPAPPAAARTPIPPAAPPPPAQTEPATAGAAPWLDIAPDSSAPDTATDWSRSYHGLSMQPFPKDVAEVLLAPIDPADVEMKPDGLIYLPEIKYRRVLNRAFGPGGWGLAPRSETNVGPKVVSREYALVCLGRLVAIARGEQEYFDPNGIPTATEACKSNALMRCCKDLGVASELWDPRFIREFKARHCVEVFAEHVPTKKKKKLWRRKDQPKFEYPYKE